MSERTSSPIAVAQATWQRYIAQSGGARSEPNLRIGVAASFTPNNLVPFAAASLVAASFASNSSLRHIVNRFRSASIPNLT
jgi:hypothetical protein